MKCSGEKLLSACLVDRFCCCCSVRTGTIISAWLGILAGASFLGLSALAQNIPREADAWVTVDDDGDSVTRTYLGPHAYEGLHLRVMAIVSGCSSLLLSGLLLAGVLTRRRMLMLPSIAISAVQIVLSLPSCLTVIVLLAANLQFTLCAIVLVVGVPSLALDIHLWRCVLSHYVELREKAKEKTIETIIIEPPPAYA